MIEGPPAYSTCVRMAAMPPSPPRKERSFFTHPIMMMFILMNIWLLVSYSGNWAQELENTAWDTENRRCPSTFSSLPRDDVLCVAWIELYFTQLCSLLYLKLAELARAVMACQFVGSSVARALDIWNRSNRVLLMYYVNMIVLLLSFLFVCCEFGYCLAMDIPLYPGLFELMTSTMVLLFSFGSIGLMYYEAKRNSKTESELEDFFGFNEE